MPDIEHRYLRSAIEFAVAIADAGQRLRPPLAYPSALKPFLKQPRIPASQLGKLRRAIEADGEFRTRLSAGALPELVDPIGIEWLRREDGWEAAHRRADRGGRRKPRSRREPRPRCVAPSVAGRPPSRWRSAPGPS